MTSLSDVFIVGGQPTLTYVAREELRLEYVLRDYLKFGYKVLSVSGPTKSGKTVLCRRILPTTGAIWLSGGEIQSEDDFWLRVVSELGAPTSLTEGRGRQLSLDLDGKAKGGLSIPLLAKGGVELGIGGGFSQTNSKSSTISLDQKTASIKALLDNKIPLVIDDFHYITRSVQQRIVRALKRPIFDGLRVVLIAVPHRAFDVVKSEKEMTGRVEQVSIPLWNKEDLSEISSRGSTPLNIVFEEEGVSEFVKQSFGSPHLMQEFCQQICRENSIYETVPKLMTIKRPPNPVEFFKRISQSTAKPAFDHLKRGPRQRTDRIRRKFKDGTVGDIYIAVLKGLAHCEAEAELTYESIRAALREVMSDNVPQAHEIGRVLVQMSKIAKEKSEGSEPVLDWVEDERTLYISDPFFAFYLRWSDLSGAGVIGA
ncbi:P-loop NTPase family protein [Inquilinus limosus]|uniref:hypothetical protein n=1 Tax=Inquilinus limosus TaxID=171674 RepID=UPI00126995C5|nr:hypothetical protein [Inquilinus limosus]